MTAREDQRKERWTTLLDAIRDAISAFQAEYKDFNPKPEYGLVPGRRLQHLYPYLPSTDDARCSDDSAVRAAIGARLHAKRARWLELWSTCVDMISAFADEHVRYALDDADWAAQAAVQMHQRLAELMWTVQTEHPDMPDIVLHTDETRRLRATLSAVDVLETWYFGLFEDEGNPRTPKRGSAARQEFREWLDYRASPAYIEPEA